MQIRAIWFLSFVSVAACSREPTTDRAQPVAAASSSSSSAPTPPAPALPPAPPGADPELVRFAASICAAATLSLDGKVLVGCRSHPPFVSPEQQPDGTLPVHTGDPLRFCQLEVVYRGSFTRPQANQAVLSFAQCKDSGPKGDDTWDMGAPGSAVLVEEIGGRWKAVDYQGEVNARTCVKARRRSGRDVLLCRSGLGAGPAGEITYFFLLDFARPNKHAGTFAWMHASGDAVCASPEEPRAPGGLSSVEVKDFSLADVDGDGTEDLVAQVDRARVAPSAALEAALSRACRSSPNAAPKAILTSHRTGRLEFLVREDSVVASPATKKDLAAWEAESPENFNGLKEAAPPRLPE